MSSAFPETYQPTVLRASKPKKQVDDIKLIDIFAIGTEVEGMGFAGYAGPRDGLAWALETVPLRPEGAVIVQFKNDDTYVIIYRWEGNLASGHWKKV